MTRTLLYDADCAFCTRSAGWALMLGCDVVSVPWQSYERLSDYRIRPGDAARVVHLVDHGEVVTGHVAIARTLRSSNRRGVRLAGRVVEARAMRPLASRTYAAVASHRYRLPGGTPACRLP